MSQAPYSRRQSCDPAAVENCGPHAPAQAFASRESCQSHRQQDAENKMPTRATSSTHPTVQERRCRIHGSGDANLFIGGVCCRSCWSAHRHAGAHAVATLSCLDAALAHRCCLRVAEPDRMSVAGRRKRVARLVGSSTESNLFPTAAERLRADWPRRNRRASRAVAWGRRMRGGHVGPGRIAQTMPWRALWPNTPFLGGRAAFGLRLKDRVRARCVSRRACSRRPRGAGQGRTTRQPQTFCGALAPARPNPAVVTT